MAQHEAGVSPRSINSEEGEQHVESPGKAKAVLSKVKDKARKLKDKIMKATNTKKDEHTNEEEEEADLYEDNHNQEDNQNKYEQLRPNGGLDKQEDGSEVEVRGRVPVSPVSAASGTYWKTENEAAPISPDKNAGPPDAMQTAPTEYRNYDSSTDPHPSLGGVSDDALVKPSSDYGDVADLHYAQETPPNTLDDLAVPSAITDYAQVKLPNTLDDDAAYPSHVNENLGTDSFAEEKRSRLSDSAAAEPYSDKELSSRGNSAASDMDEGYPEDLVKPNPAFGYPSSPISHKIGVLNEDPITDIHRDVSKENPNLPEQPSINDIPEAQESNNPETQESNNEGWGKWSGDKLNNAKDAVATKVGFNSENAEVGKAADHEIVDECRLGKISSDVDKEYSDPSTLKNNKSQEGFPLENEDTEEQVLNASLAGPAIGKLQGLKDTVASSLRYDNASSADIPHDESSEPVAALEARQPTGTEAFAEVESEEMGLSPSQQPTGGALQGLKNAVAARLGYGSSEESPADVKVAMEEQNHEAEAEVRTVSVDDVGDEGANMQPSGYAQRIFNTTAAARDYLASKVGYGNGSNDNNVASRLVSGEEGDEKLIIPANVDQLDENNKRNFASSLSPNEEDKALSQLITEKVSNTAAVLKQTLVSPSGNQTPTTPGPHDDA